MKSIFLFFICIFLLGTVSYGQIDYDKFPIVTSKFLINDAHIQKSPKDSFGIGDILIDKGYITRVAKEIKPPVDAYVIEADSAYAYPSFIAGLSHVGIAEPAKKSLALLPS